MPISTRSTKSKPASWFGRTVRWRTLWWLIGAAVALGILLILFYAEENLRGKRAWAAYQRTLKLKGVDFDWHVLAPPPVPDRDNFAMTPFLAALFDFAPGTHTPRDMAAYNRTAGFAQTGAPYDDARSSDPVPAMLLQHRIDLAAELELFRKPKGHPSKPAEQQPKPSAQDRTAAARAVLEVLKQFNPVLDELRAASRRPQSRFNFPYDADTTWRTPQPHLPVLKRVCRVLMLRASAELATHNAPAAVDDIDLIFKLANSIRDEPFQSSCWARYAMLSNARQIIWEGLGDHSWSSAQLESFQRSMQSLALLNNLQKPLRLEQASRNQLFEDLHRNPSMPKSWQFGSGLRNRILPYFLWLMPSGWMYREQIAYHRSFEKQLMPMFESGSPRIQPQLIYQIGNDSSPFWNHRCLTDLLLRSINWMITEAAFSQMENDLAIVACALERYHLTNGQFPETLDALTSQYITSVPPDVLTGQPLKYHRSGDGRFQLYSDGWNGKDDGGKFAMNSDGKAPDLTEGDWVWPQYPEE
jgi:hypothetical protein